LRRPGLLSPPSVTTFVTPSRLPLRASYPAALSPLASSLPVLQGHGDEDMVSHTRTATHALARFLAKASSQMHLHAFLTKLRLLARRMQVVGYHWGKAAYGALRKLMLAGGDGGGGAGSSVEFRTYEGMGHSACDEELRDVAHFLRGKLGYRD